MERTESTGPLTEDETAQRLRVSRAALRAWRLSGKGPRFCRFGRAVRYLEGDIEQFKVESRIDPGRDGARSA